MGLRIVLPQKIQRLVRKYDAKTEGGVGGILLKHVHIGGRLSPLDQLGKIKAGWTRAEDGNAHGLVAQSVHLGGSGNDAQIVWLYAPTSGCVRNIPSTALNISRMRCSDTGLSTTTTSS